MAVKACDISDQLSQPWHMDQRTYHTDKVQHWTYSCGARSACQSYVTRSWHPQGIYNTCISLETDNQPMKWGAWENYLKVGGMRTKTWRTLHEHKSNANSYENNIQLPQHSFIHCHVICIVLNPPTTTNKVPSYPSTNVLLARMMACSHNTL